MGLYQYIRKIWKDPQTNLGALWTQRLIDWRKEPVTLRIERPTRLDRARSLGYKAKPGFLIVRQRVDRGGRMRPKLKKGRKSSKQRRKLVLGMNYQEIAERRAVAKFVNCEVLNSYEVAKDGSHYWFEVILVDPNHPSVMADKHTAWLSQGANKRRAMRGLTSAGRKSRGLRNKGKGAEKIRPSLGANSNRGK
jgi:large subunit ribosomal protein L15e